MSVNDYYWEHRDLLKYLREVPKSTTLFKQGDEAHSMFLLIRGLIELRSTINGEIQTCGLVEAGQFLGEKSVVCLAPYKRAFSAFARTDLAVLEMKWSDVEAVGKDSSALLVDMLKQIFLKAAQRLDRNNGLIHVLRSSNNVERVLSLIRFFGRYNGRKVEEGTEIFLSESMIRYYVDIPLALLQEIISELHGKRLLLRQSDDVFVIPNVAALAEHSKKISEQIATRQFDELESIP